VRLLRDDRDFLKASLPVLRRVTRLYLANRSPRAFLQAFSHVYRKAAGRAAIQSAILAITYRCQARCPHCYARDGSFGVGPEMSTEEFRAVLGRLKDLGTLQVFFTGGEPLLRGDLFDLVAHAHHLGLLTRLNTNGYLLTRACAAELKRAGLNQCGISIDDADPSVHDRLRGLPGAFERAMQGFRYLGEYSIDKKILGYVTHENISGGLERIIELGRKIKANSIFFNIPFQAGRLSDRREEVLSDKEMARLRGLLKYPFVSIEFPTPQILCCACAKSIITINPVGDVLPCPAVLMAVGNAREEPLSSIWHRHASALRLETRGRCPLNDERDLRVLREHAAAMRARRPIPS
jgi:MoaA/NifB/PqqE/SkfB family radical SAM enzyme